jgi:hypothetical protein
MRDDNRFDLNGDLVDKKGRIWLMGLVGEFFRTDGQGGGPPKRGPPRPKLVPALSSLLGLLFYYGSLSLLLEEDLAENKEAIRWSTRSIRQ